MLVFVTLVLGALVYIHYSLKVSLDYDEVCSKSYHINEHLHKRDEFLGLLIANLKQHELRESGQDKENFVASPLLQELLESKANYETYRVTDFKKFEDANQRYLTDFVKYLNYVSENKPEYIDRTMQYHVSYVIDYNKKMLSTMEHYNSLVDLYIERLNGPIYSKIASKDKEYDKFTQVAPFELTDYLDGKISTAWNLEDVNG